MRLFFPLAILLLSLIPAAPAADRPLVASKEAAAQVDKVATIRGKVIEVRRVAHGPVIFEFDGKPGAPAFRALVYPRAVPRFGFDPERIYLGKVAEVTGLVIVRKDLPQTWINDPSEIRLAETNAERKAER